MPLVNPFRRRRAGLLAAGAAALVVAIVATVALTASPAVAAIWETLPGTPTCNCVLKNGKDNTYRAVFGYTSNASVPGTIPAGPNNRLEVTSGSTPSALGLVTTEFEPGAHPATFATDWISKDTTVVWRVGGKTASGYWNQSSCGSDVMLPAGGNGAGPLVALLLAGLVALFVLWRKRRKAA
ncbi:hypothetical protein [Actinoplanes regularis]|uniref:LPXTG-motif cell wall anchor domain-containing protein n=1 Tax=Actinoplanes regularis TaxID=52697 RepID=A0A238YER2_9ACTN|nr:hypothetical protein [Actinoplanes regularis]GIE85967.1 hypothetical protein Are01nite_24470 [Actinoplanes regularis]SNR69268.1 hypothetical protein SAMN06264365_104481 [Actinoplanes regularis]